MLDFSREAKVKENVVKLGWGPGSSSASQRHGTVQHTAVKGNWPCGIMGRGGDKKTRERGIGEFLAAGTEIGQGCQKQQRRRPEKQGFVKGN